MKLKNILEAIGAILFGILAVATIILQIYTSKEPQPQLVVTLFNILQFTFSIVFAWIVTRIVTKKEFEESYKKFAISAFRRILDIRENFNFIKQKIHEKSNQRDISSNDLDMIEAMTYGVEQTINSSISDWSDIIGDEILVVEQIEKIKVQKEAVLQEVSPLIHKEPIGKTMEKFQKEIEKLELKLPKQLRTRSEESHVIKKVLKDLSSDLEKEKKEKGFVEFTAFWDPTFENDIYKFKVGEILIASIDDVGLRPGALIIKDKSGKSVGVLTNKFGYDYGTFTRSVINFLRKSKFEVKISEIDRTEKEPRTESNKEDLNEERHYFIVRTIEE